MNRILIPALLVLCAGLAPAADSVPSPVPAEGQAVTCPQGKVPGCQRRGDGQGKGQCQRRRDGSGGGRHQGQRGGTCPAAVPAGKG